MPPKANSRIRDVIELDLPISEVADFLDSLDAQRCAIIRTMSDCYLAWSTTSYVGLEQKLKDDDTYGVVVRFGMGCNALICKTPEQADKVARQIVTKQVTESTESRIVGAVDLGGEQVHNLYKLVSSEGFKPVPIVLTHGRGFTLFDDKDGTDDVTHHNLGDYLAQHGQFALAINNGWFYIAAISADRKALEKFARKLAKGLALKESASRIVGDVSISGLEHYNFDASKLYELVRNAGFEALPTSAPQAAQPEYWVPKARDGLSAFNNNAARMQPLSEYLAAHKKFAVVVHNTWFYLCAVGGDRQALEKFARSLSKDLALKESASRIVGTLQTPLTAKLYDMATRADLVDETLSSTPQDSEGFRIYAEGSWKTIPLERFLDSKNLFAVVIVGVSRTIAMLGRNRAVLEKYARDASKLSAANESVDSRIVGRVPFKGNMEDAADIFGKSGSYKHCRYCRSPHGAVLASLEQSLEAELAQDDAYAAIVTFASGNRFVYTFSDRRSAEKFVRMMSKQAVSEAIKSDVTDLGVVETDKTITADKGGLRNYLRGKFNVLGINREVYSEYHYNYGGSAHDGEYHLPNSHAYGPLASLASRLVTQRVFAPGTKSSDLAIVRFVHHEAVYSLDGRYVIGFKPAVEKLIRSVRSDAVKLEALPDPGKL